MTQRIPPKPEREGFEKIKYDLLKWSAFLAPPTVLYIGWYAIFRDMRIALVCTALCLVVFLISVAYWYYTKTSGKVV